MISTRFSCCYLIDESCFFFNSLTSTQTLPTDFQIKDKCSIINIFQGHVLPFTETLPNILVLLFCHKGPWKTLVKWSLSSLKLCGSLLNLTLFNSKRTPPPPFDNWMYQLPEFWHIQLLRRLLKFVFSLTARRFRTFLHFRILLKQCKPEPNLGGTGIFRQPNSLISFRSSVKCTLSIWDFPNSLTMLLHVSKCVLNRFHFSSVTN